ncbi:hypothetical protein ACFL50_01615 [Candidatus Latescibacterota bacterium]
MKKIFFILFIISLLSGLMFFLCSCNNPFSTREPENPGSEGARIKPPNSPENVLYNLESSLEGLSVLDYLNIFSEDFEFNPDPEDSLKYVEDFINGWNYEKEEEFANNFLQQANFTNKIEGNPIYLDVVSIIPGVDLYEYTYNIFVVKDDSTETAYNTIEIEGEAWLYFREDEGNWYIYKWIDHRIQKNSITWGALRAQHI